MLSTAKIGGNGGFAFTDETLYNANGAFSALKIWIDSRYHVINALDIIYYLI
jgi:hypothetical protein